MRATGRPTHWCGRRNSRLSWKRRSTSAPPATPQVWQESRPPASCLAPGTRVVRKVNLLDAGHRAADALVRSTELATELETAFNECASGNATSLADRKSAV